MLPQREFSRREWLRAASTLAAATALPGSNSIAAPSSTSPEAEGDWDPEAIGFDSVRLNRAFEKLKGWTEGPNAAVPGAAILVGRAGRRSPVRLFGRQGPEPDADPIRRDAMFYLASVTKPVVVMAAMTLVERGELNLCDPVTRYIPEFTGDEKKDTLVLHLMTHTSGLPDELPDNGTLRQSHAPLSRFIETAIGTKLLFPSGTQHRYSSSGILLVAEIIQRLSGQTVQAFVRKEILDPLGLKSTGLGSQGFDRARLVRTTLPEYQQPEFGWNSRYWQEFGSPAGGMFGSPEDFAAICETMLNMGQYGKTRLLSPATVRQMTTNRFDDMPDLPEPVRRTQPWGLGWRLNHPGTTGSWGDLLGRHVFGHTGSAGNVVWMDPKTKAYCIIFTNYLRARAPWRLVHLSNAVASAIL